jgi:hypothetical protein
MGGTGKFSHVVKATSHMRSGSESPQTEDTSEKVAAPEPKPEVGQGGSRPGPGRPRTGKRSNPGYQQVTALLPAELYGRVRVKLIEEKSHGDFSELLRGLLESWLAEGEKA